MTKTITAESLREVLPSILRTHSPSGDEDEINKVLLPLFVEASDQAFEDEFGNIIGVIRGEVASDPLKVLSHKDEIGFVVKRILEDGRICVDMLGATYPWKYGEIPVDVLGRKGIVKGVLSMGSLHTSPGGHPIRDFIEKRTVLISDVVVQTLLSTSELAAAGIYPGTRIVVAREFKEPIFTERAIMGYHLDNKLSLALMLLVMRALKLRSKQLRRDVYFVATCMEEVGTQGAAYVGRTIPGSRVVALEIGPVAEEYGILLNEKPVLWYGPGAIYHKKTTDALMDLAGELRFGSQPAYLWGAGTDSAKVLHLGMSTEAICIAFPCDNTHGYEIASIAGAINMAILLEQAIARSIL